MSGNGSSTCTSHASRLASCEAPTWSKTEPALTTRTGMAVTSPTGSAPRSTGTPSGRSTSSSWNPRLGAATASPRIVKLNGPSSGSSVAAIRDAWKSPGATGVRVTTNSAPAPAGRMPGGTTVTRATALTLLVLANGGSSPKFSASVPRFLTT